MVVQSVGKMESKALATPSSLITECDSYVNMPGMWRNATSY